MKKIVIKSTILILAMAASLMASGPRVTQTLFVPVQNEIVAIESAPFYSNTLANGGMIFELVQAALNSEHETATLTTYPVKNMVKYYITQEETLAALGMNFKLTKAEKKRIVMMPVALVHEQYMYYKPSHPQGLSFEGKLSKLKGLTYGATPGEDTSAYKEAGIKVVYAESRFLFGKLKSQKVDFIKGPVLSSRNIIDSSFEADKDKFVVMKSKAQNSVCMIYFNLQNKHAKEISNKFRKGLTQIIKNGQYQKILEKYQRNSDDVSKSIQELKTLLKKGF